MDAKHTPKITAPNSVKRGQWFDVMVDFGAGGEHPSLSEHFIRYIALYINTRRSRESISTRSILFPRLHSGLRLMREAHYGRWPSRTIPPAGKRQKRSRWFLSARRRGFTFCPSPQSLSWFLCRPRSILVSLSPSFPARPAGCIFPVAHF